MPDLQEAVYVYGVAAKAGFHPPAVAGVEDAEVGSVEHEGLVALTSPIRHTELAARDLRAHWRVLEHTFESSTVLPVRFGTVMESSDAVVQSVLAPNAEQLSDLLVQLEGRVQLNLKGRYDEEGLLRQVIRDHPEIDRLRGRVAGRGALPDQVALGQLVEQAITQRRAHDTALARRTLDPLAVAVREEEVGHPIAFNIAFLVDRDAIDPFGEALGTVRQELEDRIEIRFVGPAPPFSFADAELTPGTVSWA